MTSPRQNNVEGRHPIAPAWHTACVVTMLASISGLLVYLKTGSGNPELGHVPLCSIVTALEWAVFAFSLRGSNPAFRGHVARAVQDRRSLLLDIPVALLLSVISYLIGLAMVRVLGRSGWVSVEGMRPSSGVEIAAWILMAISAGICEETVYRGYLQQQFSGWSGHLSIGVLGQAAIFGLSHGYQGWKNMVTIFVLGCIYGVFAWLRKGLRANIIAHAGMDILSAF